MPLLVKNARIVTATADYTADIYCERDTITRIDRTIDQWTLPPCDILDAAGLITFPGFIDPHVHVYLPFMGTFAKDTWASASRAALLGGTTTLVEMICPARADDPVSACDLWRSKARESVCDYSFHMGVTRFDERTPAALKQIVDSGITSFKVFLAYKGALGIDDHELFDTLRLARELGVVVAAHCENEELVALLQKQLLAAGKTGPEWHEPSRPAYVEASGVHHLCAFAEATGARVYIVHTSCEPAVQEARRAAARGVRVDVEAVIPHLTLDRSYAERPDFDGAKYVMSPPLREKRHQEALWRALAAGDVATVATDHAPFDFATQKSMGKGDFTKIPNGIPSVEDRVNLLYTRGVCEGRIDLHTFVRVASTNAARILGLSTKGDIAVGLDADLCLYDSNHRGVISATTHAMQTDYSAFEGFELKGRPRHVVRRGEIVVRDAALVANPSQGRLTPRVRTG